MSSTYYHGSFTIYICLSVVREISAGAGHSHLTSTPFTETTETKSCFSLSQGQTPFSSLFLLSDTEIIQGSFEENTAIDTLRSELNNFLASMDKSRIRSSLNTPWADAGERTKRYYVKKASEVVAESLKVIAGEECDKLRETLVSSRAMKQHLTSSRKEDVDLALFESLVECYNNAT